MAVLLNRIKSEVGGSVESLGGNIEGLRIELSSGGFALVTTEDTSIVVYDYAEEQDEGRLQYDGTDVDEAVSVIKDVQDWAR